jgi:hypothetical protein
MIPAQQYQVCSSNDLTSKGNYRSTFVARSTGFPKAPTKEARRATQDTDCRAHRFDAVSDTSIVNGKASSVLSMYRYTTRLPL